MPAFLKDITCTMWRFRLMVMPQTSRELIASNPGQHLFRQRLFQIWPSRPWPTIGAILWSHFELTHSVGMLFESLMATLTNL